MIDEVRLSKQIQDEIGYEPPSRSFAAPGYLSHRLAVRPDQYPRPHLRHERLLALVAALLAIALVAGLVWAARELHSKQTVPVNNPRPAPGTAALRISNSWFFSREDGAVDVFNAAGTRTAFITHNGGQTWLPTPLENLTWPSKVAGGCQESFDCTQTTFLELRWLDSQHIVAVRGSFDELRNVFATTADGGYQWQSTKLRNFFWQPGITFFRDAHEGWALCGAGGNCGMYRQDAIYHTIDSGAHWQRLGTVGEYQGVNPLGLFFTDSKHGFMSTLDADGVGRLIATVDGGQSWRLLELPSPPGGWQPGSQSFVQPPQSPPEPVGPSCSDSTCVLLPAMFGEQGVLLVEQHVGDWFTYTTSDGGLTWGNPRALPARSWQPEALPWRGPLDANDWWIVDAGGKLLLTSDGGMGWQHIQSSLPAGYSLATVTPAGGNVLWGTAATASNGQVAVRSTDGGANWSLVLLPAK
jgi:photosystem II stability/assembly factor-like uncharacterized protein